MRKFEDAVREETPRLVLLYNRDPKTGQDQFQWGIVGQIPLLSLLGGIARVQSELFFRAAAPCPVSAFVLAWDAEKRAFDWFVGSFPMPSKGYDGEDTTVETPIPLEPVCGMLETIKGAIVTGLAARRFSNQQLVLGPDGNPMRRT